MIKASIGTALQTVIPIVFLSFMTIMLFLYSKGSNDDEARGLKIMASSFIVATYISYIIIMRGDIPPTPAWSIFEITILILAATSILPLIEALFVTDYSKEKDLFNKNY